MHYKYEEYLIKIKKETINLLKSQDFRLTKKLKFLEILKYMLKNNIKKSKREIYYTCPVIFETQKIVNSLIEYYCILWNIEMREINISISLKGLFIGNLIFEIKGKRKHIERGLIPDMTTVESIKNKYKKVLVVEKDSIMSFINEIYLKENLNKNFLLVSGKGYPDTNTKYFLKEISKDKKIEIFGLFDFDPFGLDIYRIYKETIKCIKRIGILSSDIFLYSVNEREMIELKPNDFKKMNSINLFNENEFKEDLLFLNGLRKKCEIEIFTSFDSNFIIKYLNHKLNLLS